MNDAIKETNDVQRDVLNEISRTKKFNFEHKMDRFRTIF